MKQNQCQCQCLGVEEGFFVKETMSACQALQANTRLQYSAKIGKDTPIPTYTKLKKKYHMQN
jgi:hypothetical protein